MTLSFATPDDATRSVHLLAESATPDWRSRQAQDVQAWIDAHGFTGAIGQALLLPGGRDAVIGYGSESSRARGRFHVAAAAAKLPKGTYRLVTDLPADQLQIEALGWLLATYRFDRYKDQSPMVALLVAPDGIDAARTEAIAQGEALTRTLINTPAADMGPPDLEQAARDLATQHRATITVTTGDDLLTQNLPMIHAVGRAADRAPRLIDLTWGDTGPKLTLVGKGVCFDTGGLNLKPGASMGLMKKDMGGSASVLGLAHMIMATDLPIQLRVLIPAVENSVSGNAFRPQDILTSRKGLTVEVNNTDAEGRLVLADTLAFADEDTPDLIISMATLTGAARVAVGPDLAPYYTDEAPLSAALENAAATTADPVWRMPFHTPYEALIEPGIADLDNAPKGGFAGSITAALFLRRFVDSAPYIHFDIYGWQPSSAPARPKGGVGQGTRALLDALPKMLKL
ncbi:leucyl aminopeptidase family protein [Tateyamaria omphalii]|uniref:Leucyl aminopeptidase n=1 Tax=Tateyamaria omphalii TaxID=299262 RepID=A0A1P8MY93_9RHOB|nr:leucyl aminopeptidase family protein [Tateyamaria omphalii]APX13003.1 leucyl aminopeptidase [Tateyamaria omphalii]